MKIKVILSKKINGDFKSNCLSPELSQLVFDAYIPPSLYAYIVTNLNEKEFDIDIPLEETA